MPQGSLQRPQAGVQLSEAENLQTFMQRQGGEYFDRELAAEISRIGQTLAKGSQRPDLPYRFIVLDRTAPELHLFPKGQILLTRGLLAGLNDVRELRGLLTAAISAAARAPAAAHRTIGPGELSVMPTGAADSTAGSANLAELLSGLQQDRPGYELFEVAKRREQSGDLPGAISVYLQAATAAPDQPQILTGLGLAYLLAGDLRSARVHLQKAVRLQPYYYLSRMGLGYVDLQLKRYAEAIDDLEQSVKLLPIVRNRFLLAESYQENGQPEAAIPLYQAVAQIDEHGKLGRAALQRLQAMGH